MAVPHVPDMTIRSNYCTMTLKATGKSMIAGRGWEYYFEEYSFWKKSYSFEEYSFENSNFR